MTLPSITITGPKNHSHHYLPGYRASVVGGKPQTPSALLASILLDFPFTHRTPSRSLHEFVTALCPARKRIRSHTGLHSVHFYIQVPSGAAR